MYIMKGGFTVKLHSEKAANEFCKSFNSINGIKAERIANSSFDIYVTTRTKVRLKWSAPMILLKSCTKWTAWCYDICYKGES